MVPSKSLNTASGLAAVELDSLERSMNSLRLLMGNGPSPWKQSRLGTTFLCNAPIRCSMMNALALGHNKKQETLEVAEHQCFAMR
jgi:hypothetical protein